MLRTREKLEKLEREIADCRMMDENFKTLISRRLYKIIEEEPVLKNLFLQRTNLLEKLATDPKIIQLQDDLIETLGKIAKLVSIEMVQKIQKDEDEMIEKRTRGEIKHNRFSIDFKKYNKNEQLLSDVYEAALDSTMYWRFGDEGMKGLQNLELSKFCPTGIILQQYQDQYLKSIICMIIRYSGILEINENQKKYDKLVLQYRELYSQLFQKIYNEPADLNVSEFETLEILIKTARNIGGTDKFSFWGFYFWNPEYLQIKKVKEVVKIVISDLLDELEKHSNIYKEQNTLSIKENKEKRKQGSVSSNLLEKTKRAHNWEEITLELCADERMEILIGNESLGVFHISDMGFSKTNTVECKMIKAFKTLIMFLMNEGSYSTETSDAYSDIKQLKISLRQLFPNVIGEPINTDSINGTYKMKLKLLDKGMERHKYMDNKSSKRPSEFLGNNRNI
jgi:hypothetical protein